MELIKDYDCDIKYHPSKVNVVVNALSRKQRSLPLCAKLFTLETVPNWIESLKKAQHDALMEENLKDELMKKNKELLIEDN